MKWPHKSTDDLALAGYKCRGPVKCPTCGDMLWIYQIPGELPVYLNSYDYWPHLVTTHNEEAPPARALDGKSAAAGER
jgi:hypothetical protein